MSDEGSGFVGFVIGIILSILVMITFTYKDVNKARVMDVAIEICEAELPRNQSCEIIAVLVEAAK